MSGTWQLHVEREEIEDVLIVRLRGRLSDASAHHLREALTTPEGIGVVVDLTALDYISGAGLDVLDQAAQVATNRGRGFVLCGVEGSVRIAFELSGLSGRLAVEPTREGALTTAAGRSRPSARRES